MRSTADVMLRTSDLEAAKAHYHGELGFAIVADSKKVVGFDTGSFTLYFEPGDSNGSVFEFEVSDIEEAKKRLVAQGCSIVEENPKIPRCYLRDRFGLIFNLTQTWKSN
jgi:catechol 2,3-dioxygenase-like lactoylglutathione lyase family enzyme